MTRPAFEFKSTDSKCVVFSAQAKDWHRLSRLLRQLAAPDLPDWLVPTHGICQAIAHRVHDNDVITQELFGTLRWFLFARPAYPVLDPNGADVGVKYSSTMYKWEGDYGHNRRKVAAMMADVAYSMYEFLRTTPGGMYIAIMPYRDPNSSMHRLYFSIYK